LWLTLDCRFALRVKGRSQLSAAKLRLFESLRLTKGGANGGKPDRIEAASLLARLRVFPFDFEAAHSVDQEKAITACREIVRSGTLVDAKSLWDRLVGFAAEARTTGGYFDLPRLVRQLHGAVELKDFPDHRMDWDKLDQRALGNMAGNPHGGWRGHSLWARGGRSPHGEGARFCGLHCSDRRVGQRKVRGASYAASGRIELC